MSSLERPDDFELRRAHLKSMSDEALHEYFWDLVDQIIAPLIEEARTHTSPAIERSVLLRMGFSSIECKQLVDLMQQRGLLGHGAGRLVLEQESDLKLPARPAEIQALVEERTAVRAAKDWARADEIRDELDAWRESCVTEFLVSGPAQMLPSFAELILGQQRPNLPDQDT